MNTSSSSEDDDPTRQGRAFNQSIYFMLGVPYFLIGTFSFVIYRKVMASERKTLQALAEAGGKDVPPV